MKTKDIGKFSGEVRGLTETGNRRIVIRDVRPEEVELVEEEARNLPNYVSHRKIRKPSGNYDIYIYLSR